MANKAQQERIGKWVSRWKSRLLLDNWAVTIHYKEKDLDDKRTDGTPSGRCADILVDPRYREALLNIYPVLLTKPIGFQKATILHEVCHIITDPVKRTLETACNRKAISAKLRDDIMEGITEDIAKIVLRTSKPSKDNYRL